MRQGKPGAGSHTLRAVSSSVKGGKRVTFYLICDVYQLSIVALETVF
jgi:hypothetical protein